MSGVVLKATGLYRTLGTVVQQEVIRGIDLTIRQGEFVALTGPSGSGKSTLLYLLGALDRPTAGEVEILGLKTSVLSDEARAELRRKHVGFVFQFHFLLPEFTARENVAIPLRRRGIGGQEAYERADDVLQNVGLYEKRHRRPGELSGGEQQRVAVARAIVGRPTLLLADEPTGNLDSTNAEVVFQILQQLADQSGIAVVMVTHDLLLAARCRRRVQIKDGVIVSDQEIFS